MWAVFGRRDPLFWGGVKMAFFGVFGFFGGKSGGVADEASEDLKEGPTRRVGSRKNPDSSLIYTYIYI